MTKEISDVLAECLGKVTDSVSDLIEEVSFLKQVVSALSKELAGSCKGESSPLVSVQPTVVLSDPINVVTNKPCLEEKRSRIIERVLNNAACVVSNSEIKPRRKAQVLQALRLPKPLVQENEQSKSENAKIKEQGKQTQSVPDIAEKLKQKVSLYDKCLEDYERIRVAALRARKNAFGVSMLPEPYGVTPTDADFLLSMKDMLEGEDDENAREIQFNEIIESYCGRLLQIVKHELKVGNCNREILCTISLVHFLVRGTKISFWSSNAL